jgi:anti-sigma regulatory factor (Ser/Thr protein kinase)
MEKLVLPAKLENLQAMLEFVKKGARSKGFDDKKINHMQLAAEEVLVNIINYAYPGRTGDVEIRLMLEESKGLKVEVIDSGIPFNPLARPEPDINAPIEQRNIGGLGVYLLRRLMNEITYKREGERNILTFTKY